MKKLLLVICVLTVIITGCSSTKETDSINSDIENYLNEIQYDELSMEYLLTEVARNSDNIFIENFEIAFTSDGYVSLLNLDFEDMDQSVGKSIIYRRNSDLFVIHRTDNTENSLLLESNMNVLRLFDENMMISVDHLNADEVIRYELLVPTKIDMEANIGDYINNIKIQQSQEVEGITFVMYRIPIEQGDKLIHYIYAE